jgi:hypothetical protein
LLLGKPVNADAFPDILQAIQTVFRENPVIKRLKVNYDLSVTFSLSVERENASIVYTEVTF